MEEKYAVYTKKEERKPFSRIRLFLTGCVMGVADLTPGVSGGTIALVANIYSEFIASLKAVTNTALGLTLRGDFKEAFRAIPFNFLIPLFAGIGIAVLTLAHVVSWLLEAHAVFVWSFFFGLIVASIVVIFRGIRTRSFGVLLATVIGAVFAYIVSGLISVETPPTSLFFFLSGVIAITAMILPGISGSFLLVILGKYQQFITAAAERDVATLALFALGAFIGLALFSRIISYFLRAHHDIMIALLSGFMIGSLRTIWPWKGELTNGLSRNVFPEVFDLHVLSALLLAVLGAVMLFTLERYGRRDPVSTR